MIEIIGASGQAELKAQEKVSSLTKTLRADTGKAALVCQVPIASSCSLYSLLCPLPLYMMLISSPYGLVSAYSFSSFPLELIELAVERIFSPAGFEFRSFILFY